LWSNLSNKSNQSNSSNSIHLQKWPEVGKIVEESAVIAVMVNGKLRSTISVGAGFSRPSQSEIEKLAKEKICHYLENKQIKKVVFVPGKVINCVV
jgi:leucyl-tRNA synthetase